MYDLQYTPRAARDVKRLRPPMRDRVLRRIEALRDEPRPHGAEKLTDEANLWKVWVSRSYRILYSVDDERQMVTIAAAGPHDVYHRS